MARRSAGPLTEADLNRVNEALRGLENVHREVEMALSAGLQCQPEDALCRDLEQRLNQIKTVYFPMHP